MNERSKPRLRWKKTRKSLRCVIVTLSRAKQRPVRPKTAAFKLRTREKRVFVKQSVIHRKVSLLIQPCEVFPTRTCLGCLHNKNYYTFRHRGRKTPSRIGLGTHNLRNSNTQTHTILVIFFYFLRTTSTLFRNKLYTYIYTNIHIKTIYIYIQIYI